MRVPVLFGDAFCKGVETVSLVQTDKDNVAARMMGLVEAPEIKEKSAESIIEVLISRIAGYLNSEKVTEEEPLASSSITLAALLYLRNYRNGN